MRLRHAALTCMIAVVMLAAPHAAAGTAEFDPELRKRLKAAVESADSFKDRFEAEAWLMDMSSRLSRYVSDQKERLELLKLVHFEANRVGLPPELVLAVIEVESAFDPWAISRAGALGLMQIMPFWLKEIGHPDDNLHDPRINVRMGTTILKYYIDMEDGDMRAGLARYNGSAGRRKYPDKVFAALSERWYRYY